MPYTREQWAARQSKLPAEDRQSYEEYLASLKQTPSTTDTTVVSTDKPVVSSDTPPDLFAGKYGVFELLIDDPVYGPELKKIKQALLDKNQTLADDLWNRSKWGRLDTDAQQRILLELQNKPIYNERLKSWLAVIKPMLASKGLTADDATLENYWKNGIDNDTILNELSGKITAAGATGAAASNLQKLKQTAVDNGLNLDTDFAGQVDSWLQQIANGKPVTDFQQAIRDKAAGNKSKYVQDQLKLGNDLRTIYSRYLNAMSTAFGVDATTFDLNDPLLKQAFTDKGPLSTNDFQKLIRGDARYGTTPSAASDQALRQFVTDRALALGAKVADADIDSIVSKLLATGITPSQTSIDAELRKFITYAAGGAVTGQAGDALAQLRKTASDNGLDLDKAFGGSIQDWLQKIDQGESIDTYKRLIRSTAGMGLPDNVKKMLDTGVDLKTVYDPYRNLMARVLEINPESIGLDDPTLRSAIGPDKEMSLYDWQRALRKDSRWQYTNNARQETSDAALRVLRDFGFQG